jgi:hypothetical protein
MSRSERELTVATCPHCQGIGLKYSSMPVNPYILLQGILIYLNVFIIHDYVQTAFGSRLISVLIIIIITLILVYFINSQFAEDHSAEIAPKLQ